MTPTTLVISFWKKFDGWKTAIGMALIFISAGLEAVGAPVDVLNVLGMLIGLLGLSHKIVKARS